jgi:hydroxymethylpyrimidine/phosphomethylpyrimidine kinase
LNEAVLVLSGLDPCGGAGIAADIETINQFGLTPLPIVTTMTVQSMTRIGPIFTINYNCWHTFEVVFFSI